ncbi:polysaccharide biosynthesis/export protein (plasmid) [Ensifer sp. WSM1721]|uniref:polysaccharide biosynthesis/export family protein n=1 Tax=Ensifer sp. WSM1721 TaxID=1041159 RepID=UPI003525D85D
MKRVTALLLCTALAGCQAVPGEGPLATDIVADAGQSGAQIGRKNATVFDIVDVDGQSARLVSDYVATTLSRRFGIGGGVGQVVIGVGDQLKVTIFEAGSDGLFSTTESKQTSIDLVVQPDGKAAIPYVGSVRFAGLTLEQARQAILDALKQKAVEPDVIVTSTSTASRIVTVSGAVGRPSVVPLNLVSETINEVIAKAGGPAAQPYETYVTLVRGKKTGTVLLKSIIANPSENIHVKPGDQIFVTRDPRTFTILGQVRANQRVEFGSNDLNLLEAVALAGGGADQTVDAKGYFVFRYEEPDIVMSLLGQERFHTLLSKGMKADSVGRYPIVYRFNMTNPDSLIVGQTFPIKNRDVIYASRHPSVDIAKFLEFVAQPIGVASSGVSIANSATD